MGSEKIRQQLQQVEKQLDALPVIARAETPTTFGYHSEQLDRADTPVEIEVRFPKASPADLIVLMPAGYSDGTGEFGHFGFPERFYIERILADGTPEVVVDYRNNDYSIKGLEPQLFPLHDPKPIQGIRITCTRSPSNQPARQVEYSYAFSELYVWAGAQNIALDAQVTASNSVHIHNAWASEYLVDGITFFSPIDLLPHPLVDFRIRTTELTLEYDLGEAKTIDELRIWPATRAHPYRPPLIHGTDFPMEIRLEKISGPGDLQPQLLYQNSTNSCPPGPHPIMHRLPPTQGRYFRLNLGKPFPDPRQGSSQNIALGEIELLGNGQPVNDEIIPTIPQLDVRKRKVRGLLLLSDGQTSDGHIIPLRMWLEQFSQQRKLLRRKAALESALELALQREKELMTVLITTGYAMIVILLLLIVVVRLLASRRWAKMREKIAADLHDEVGANLSSIAHSSELIGESIASPTPTQTRLLNETIRIARNTAHDTRQFIHMLDPKQNNAPLTTRLHGCAAQILGSVPFTFQLEEKQALNRLRAVDQWHLLMYFKEAMNNIIKHAKPIQVTITIRRESRHLCVIIHDDGIGQTNPESLPRHLAYRARKLNAQLVMETEPDRGTTLKLKLPRRSTI